MDFANATDLDSDQLRRLLLRHTAPYRHDHLVVRVRYSRGADFSGTCFYADHRIFVNLGQHLTFPYTLGTNVARSQSNGTRWWRETYRILVRTPCHLALFVYLHELYHHLVKAAKRNPRRKEAMCDRFALRPLVDDYGYKVLDSRGRPVSRDRWDFQDVHAFVARAPKQTAAAENRDIPVRIAGARAAGTRDRPPRQRGLWDR